MAKGGEEEEEEKGGEKKCRAAIEKDEIYLPVCTRASVDSISREVLYVSKQRLRYNRQEHRHIHSCIEEYTGCPVQFSLAKVKAKFERIEEKIFEPVIIPLKT